MKNIWKDIYLLVGILLAAFLFWLIPYLTQQEKSAVVKVLQDGTEIAEYSLTQDRTVSIPSGDGGYNLLLLSDGKASVTDADCPDRFCVRQKEISKNGESIICLPHKLVITIDAKEESDQDAVTY